MEKDDINNDAQIAADTITIDISDLNEFGAGLTIDHTTVNTAYQYPTYSIGTTSGLNGTSGAYLTSGAAGASGSSIWTASNSWTTPNSGLHVKDTATFDGDVVVKGRSLEKMLQKIEDRLAILQEPSPEKLEKYAALKKAYEHYKTLERLIGED